MQTYMMKILFVVSEKNTLNVHSQDEDLQGEYEGIDVENGEYQFFDERGRPLKPIFDKSISTDFDSILVSDTTYVLLGSNALILLDKESNCKRLVGLISSIL